MSSGSIRIIQLPEKSSVNTDDYMAVDSSANGTKKVKFTDLLDDNLSVQNKAADAQATGEAINDISARVDNMINTQQNASVTTLWTGRINLKNETANLSESINNFDFIDVYCGSADTIFARTPVSSYTHFELQSQNMSDDASAQFMRWWETGLVISGTTATITKAIKCFWDDFSTAPIVSQATGGGIDIVRIDGVKIGHADNDEIIDARVGANGVTYPTLGDAIRGQVDDLQSDISVIDNNLAPIYADYYRYNTVDISEELQNGFYENGIYYANGNYRAIKHDCSVGERYKISTYLRLVNHWAIVYFYNASNVLVAKYGGDADGTLTEDTYYENYEVEVPNGATYFVVSSYLVNNKPLKLAQWEEINHSANYREVSFRYLENLNIQNGVYDHGTFYPNGSYQTVKVPCVSGDVFKIDAYYNGAANQPVAQFYDSNMVLLSTTTPITTTGQQNDVLVLVPDGCAYVVFVNYIIADRVNFNIRKYINGEYPLFQKNYIALGDSITAIKDGWRPWFQKVTGANEILCTAVSGATLCDYDDTVVDGNPEATAHSNTLSNQVQSILNNPPSDTINFIVISAGTNDHASAAEFDGGVTQFVNHSTNTYIDVDTVDRTRYDGAMRWVAEKLWSQFPNADIFWCTPIQGAEDVRQTWVQIRKCDYMKEVASHLACPVIDATRNSGIYGRYETNNANGKYLIDGLHPNMYGRKKLGLFYASEIIDYYSYEID